MKLPFISFLHTPVNNFIAIPFSISNHLRGLHSSVARRTVFTLEWISPPHISVKFSVWSNNWRFHRIKWNRRNREWSMNFHFGTVKSKITIFLSFSLKNTKRKKNNITINDRRIDMKKILFLIAKLNIRKMRRKDLKLTFHRIK